MRCSAIGKAGPGVKGGGLGNFRAEDAAAAAAQLSRGNFTLEEAIKSRRTDAAAAAAEPAPVGQDEVRIGTSPCMPWDYDLPFYYYC